MVMIQFLKLLIIYQVIKLSNNQIIYLILNLQQYFMLQSTQLPHYYLNNQTIHPHKSKYLLTSAIIIPLLIFINLNQYSYITFYCNKFSISHKLTHLIQQLDYQINATKLIVNQQKYIQFCPQIFSYQDHSHIEPALSTQQIKNMCVKDNDVGLENEIVIITVLVAEGNVQERVLEYYKDIQEKMQKYAQFQFILQIRELYPNILPKHLRDKLYNFNYNQMVAEYLQTTQFMQHCSYTYKPCENQVIVIQNQTEQYKQYESIYFTSFSNLQQMIIHILGIDTFSDTKQPIKYWQQYLQFRYLHKLKRQLLYLQQQLWSKYSKLALNHNNILTNHLQQLQNYLKNNIPLSTRHRNPLKRPSSILYNEQLNSIDIFATQYKVGILLPLTVTFLVFPFMNFIKK